jgi:hypothetical protein
VQSRIAFALVGAIVALGIAATLRSFARDEAPPVAERPPERPVRGPAEAAPRSALAESLQAEVEARRKLAQEVDWLRQEVAQLRALTGVPEHGPAPDAGAPEGESGDPEAEPSHPSGFFDEDLLLAEGGLDAAEAARLRETFEDLEMERLYLSDQAVREGWLYTPRYRREIQALTAETREALGDEGYDWMLYGAGRHNRVLINDLLSRSPASRAGVEIGDVVLRYDGQSIFTAHELQAATQQGQAGISTRLEVLREGQVVTLSVPRGPLGVRLAPTRRAPGA